MRQYETDMTNEQWERIAFRYIQPNGEPERTRTINTQRAVGKVTFVDVGIG